MDLYNDSHEKVCILSGIKETCITSTLKTGDKEITFEFRKTNRYAADIKEEGYIRTDTDEFVIKQVEPSGEWYKCTGTLNVEELEGKQYPQGFETVEKTVDECLTEAIDGTGWKVIRCDVSKKRTIRIEQNCSAWDVAQQAITTYRCEMVFDSLNKGISVYEKCGEDRGAYFIERLNLKRLQVQSNSYCLPDNNARPYDHEYSDLAVEVTSLMQKKLTSLLFIRIICINYSLNLFHQSIIVILVINSTEHRITHNITVSVN